jgi:hypothetical protein
MNSTPAASSCSLAMSSTLRGASCCAAACLCVEAVVGVAWRRLDLAEETDVRGLRTLWFAGRAALRPLTAHAADTVSCARRASRCAAGSPLRSSRLARLGRGDARLRAAQPRTWLIQPCTHATWRALPAVIRIMPSTFISSGPRPLFFKPWYFVGRRSGEQGTPRRHLDVAA